MSNGKYISSYFCVGKLQFLTTMDITIPILRTDRGAAIPLPATRTSHPPTLPPMRKVTAAHVPSLPPILNFPKPSVPAPRYNIPPPQSEVGIEDNLH